jgi:hypothetical protein
MERVCNSESYIPETYFATICSTTGCEEQSSCVRKLRQRPSYRDRGTDPHLLRAATLSARHKVRRLKHNGGHSIKQYRLRLRKNGEYIELRIRDFRFSQWEILRLWSPGIWHCVVWQIGTVSTFGVKWKLWHQHPPKHHYLFTRLYTATLQDCNVKTEESRF